MKRIALITAALLTAAAPLAAAAPAFADQGRGHYERNDHRGRHHTDVVVVKKQLWHKNDRICYDNDRFREVDYRAYRYNAPPLGYHYVRDNNTGGILLAAIATGVIASIILNN